MYILNKTLYDRTQERIRQANEELYRIQETIASGKQINHPSDNPEVAQQVLNYRTILSNINQYSENIDFGQRWSQATNDTLDTANKLLLRCREVAHTQADGTATDETRAVSATEIEGIYQDMVDLANTRHEGRYLFAPERLDTKPFDPDTAIDEPLPDNPPEFLMRIRIGDDQEIQVNTSKDVFTGGEEGKNLFKVVNQLKTGLENNDPEAIRAAWAEIDQAIEQVTRQQGRLGVNIQRLDRNQEALNDLKSLTESSLSQREDADLIGKAIDFVEKSNNQSINLATLSKILNTNLLDILG
ncbi:MAG: flagellar hook-associated protein FlgL [bacterium]